LGRYAPYALPEEFIKREYWMCTRRELHRSVWLRLVWDFLVKVCSREQGILVEGQTTSSA
jgi:hypothetical protein